MRHRLPLLLALFGSAGCTALVPPPAPGATTPAAAVRCAGVPCAVALDSARSLETAGRHVDAIRILEALAARHPDSADVFLHAGRVNDRAARRTEALRAYRRFVALAPHEARGHELVAWMELERRGYAAALAAFREADRLGPPRASVQLGAGHALAALGRQEEALRAFTAAVRLSPDDAATWGLMATTAVALGRGAEAVGYWERALVAAPGYFDARPVERRAWERAVARHGVHPPVTQQGVPAVARPAGTADAAAQRAGSEAARRRLVGEGPTSSGSGFFVTTDGAVVTNKHVVRGCTTLRVRSDGAASVPARIAATDSAHDLALLVSDVPVPEAAVFREDPQVRPGDAIVAVGYPLAGLLADQVNVSPGSVNALAGMYNDRSQLQMSAPVQPGSSGGPVLDASGRVVGVVVTKLNARVVAEAMGDIPQNVNFALKASVVRAFLDAHAVPYLRSAPGPAMTNADVGDVGRRVAVLVECWR